MSMESPQVGEISADGLFRWDGDGWKPLAKGHREPTSWTMPLRWVAAGYLVLATLYSIATTALYVNAPALERVQRAQNSPLSDQQLHDAANLGVALGWGVVIVLAAVALLLAAGSFLGWRWAFWAILAWLALSSVGVATN